MQEDCIAGREELNDQITRRPCSMLLTGNIAKTPSLLKGIKALYFMLQKLPNLLATNTFPAYQKNSVIAGKYITTITPQNPITAKILSPRS